MVVGLSFVTALGLDVDALADGFVALAAELALPQRQYFRHPLLLAHKSLRVSLDLSHKKYCCSN